MDAIDLRNNMADARREYATRCDVCDKPFGNQPDQVEKARGIVSNEDRGMALCVDDALDLFGDTNQDGEPIASDETMARWAEKAEQAQLENYAGMITL